MTIRHIPYNAHNPLLALTNAALESRPGDCVCIEAATDRDYWRFENWRALCVRRGVTLRIIDLRPAREVAHDHR